MTIARWTDDPTSLIAELDSATLEVMQLRALVNQRADQLRLANIDAFNAHAEVAELQDRLDAVAGICDQAETERTRGHQWSMSTWVASLRVALR